jgi:photosystem II stability/assembly factor-like uncharacterized protein
VGRLPAGIGARVVVIDPQQPERVYAAGDDGRVYRSGDAGQTWSRADEGLPGDDVAALALDPRHATRLYAVTRSAALSLSENGARSWRVIGRVGLRGAR